MKKYAMIFLSLIIVCILTSMTYAAPENVNFTGEEAKYIEQSKTEPISLGIIPNFAPMSIYDKKSDKFEGIIIEIAKMISQNTGLQFDYQVIELEKVTPIQSLKARRTELVAGIYMTDNFRKDSEIILSESIFDGSIVFVGLRGRNFMEEEGDKTIAVLNGFQVAIEYVKNTFPNSKILLCATTEECLDAVARKKADATLHNKYGLINLLHNPHYEKLEIMPNFILNLNNGIAARAEDSVLMSIVNKGIASITPEAYNSMLINCTVESTYQMTTADVMYKYRVPFVIIAFLLLVICVGIVLVTVLSRRNTIILEAAYTRTKEALAEAERASEAKSQFTSHMSHEIRTPLNAVTGYLTIAKNNIEDKRKVLDCIKKSELAAKHLISIIGDVLDMSSIESGKIKISSSEFDLKQLISEVTAILYAQSKQKGINFEVLLPNVTEERLVGDGLRLKQILMNLLSNAIKFTPKGGSVSFYVNQLLTQKNNVYFRFTIADTGIGMSREFMDNVFMPYEQENSQIAQNYGGSGLGLAITKNLIVMMGGTVNVESEKGSGSTFTVELPFTIDLKNKRHEIQDFSEIHALIAGENRKACEYIFEVLNRFSVHTELAYSGAEIIEKISDENARQYDLCLIDLKLPDMKISEVIQRINGIKRDKLPKIIPVAYDDSEIPAEVENVITKPLFQSTVFDMLSDLFGKKAMTWQYEANDADFTGKRLLLAEDNEMNCEIATDILNAVGFIVDSARNGKEAVEKFVSSGENYYDAVLMDVQMPEMNGYEATKTIRSSEHPRAKTIPIIAMTANAFSEDVSAALSAGMNNHVSKPIDTVHLYSVLQKHIGDGIE